MEIAQGRDFFIIIMIFFFTMFMLQLVVKKYVVICQDKSYQKLKNISLLLYSKN